MSWIAKDMRSPQRLRVETITAYEVITARRSVHASSIPYSISVSGRDQNISFILYAIVADTANHNRHFLFFFFCREIKRISHNAIINKSFI